MNQRHQPNPLGLLKISLNTLYQNPVLIYPTITLAFIQLLILEILYFAPRYPFSLFFAPLIRRVWSEEFLHYPLDLVLLPKMFYYAQIFINIFIGSFLFGVTARMVAILDEHPKVYFKAAFKETLKFYVHILCASILTFLFFQFASDFYTALLNIFLKQGPAEGSPGFMGRISLWAPYVQFLMGIVVTTLLVFVMPIIVVDHKKIFPALILNFKTLFGTFPTTFFVVFIPTMLYLPVLIVRNNIGSLIDRTVPEVQILVIVAGLMMTMAIDLLIVTTVTAYYLFIKENHEKTR